MSVTLHQLVVKYGKDRVLEAARENDINWPYQSRLGLMRAYLAKKYMFADLTPDEMIVLDHVLCGAIISHGDVLRERGVTRGICANLDDKRQQDAGYDIHDIRADYCPITTKAEIMPLIQENLVKMDDTMTMLDKSVTTEELQTYRWYQEI